MNTLAADCQMTPVTDILFISLRADFGGGPEHLWRLLKHLSPNIRASVACPDEYPYYDRYSRIVGERNMLCVPHRRFTPATFWRLLHFCRKQGVCALHSHGKGAGLYARLLSAASGLPCIHTFHGVHTTLYSPAQKMLYRLYERYCMGIFTSAAITVSEGEQRQILDEGLLPAAKLRLIPNGVDIPDRVAALPASPPYTIVQLSRCDYQKNSAFLVDILDALKERGRLRDFRCVLVGDGEEKTCVEALAREHGLESVLACVCATPEPQKYFAGALCYVSTSRWEGMPLAVLEAMAHGLPAVCSDVVGNRDAVIHGKTGFLYTEGDAAAAAAALIRLSDDPMLCKSMGDAAREHVRNKHDARKMAEATFALLQECCGR
jgi:glycosyltransferase involved in cell wall biosynthesis